jgi:hypothetical protein
MHGLEYYCDHCTGLNSEEVLHQEIDYPVHCAQCHEPLMDNFTLTGHGIDHVLGTIREVLEIASVWQVAMCSVPQYTYSDHRNGTWYEGMPEISIVQDWADHLSWYVGLSEVEENLIEQVLDIQVPI